MLNLEGSITPILSKNAHNLKRNPLVKARPYTCSKIDILNYGRVTQLNMYYQHKAMYMYMFSI